MPSRSCISLPLDYTPLLPVFRSGKPSSRKVCRLISSSRLEVFLSDHSLDINGQSETYDGARFSGYQACRASEQYSAFVRQTVAINSAGRADQVGRYERAMGEWSRLRSSGQLMGECAISLVDQFVIGKNNPFEGN